MKHSCENGTQKIMQLDRQCEKFMGGPTLAYTERFK